MSDNNKILAQSVDKILIKEIGNDSEMYQKMNSAQRDAMRRVYEICNALFEVFTVDSLEKENILQETATATCDIPAITKKDIPYSAMIITCLCAIFFSFAGQILFSKPWIVLLAGGLGGTLSIVISTCIIKARRQNSTEETKIECPQESSNSDKETLNSNVINETGDESPADQIIKAVSELMEIIGMLSKPNYSGHDITSDSKFSEWVQKVMTAVWRSDDKYLKTLVTDELETRLSTMGLFVCTEPDVENDVLMPPYDRLFIVRRKSQITEPTVTIPAICVGETALARGEIILP